MNDDVSISTGGKKVLASGTIILLSSTTNSISFKAGGKMITFEIVFVDNDEKKPSFIVEPSGEGKGKITIKNHNNNLGIGSLEPVPVAEDGNYKLFFSYKVFGNSTEPLARLFVYSFYMEGD